MKELGDEGRIVFSALEVEWNANHLEMQAMIPRLAEVRRNFALNPSSENERAMQRIQEEALAIQERSGEILQRMDLLLELTDEDREAIDAMGRSGDEMPRYHREQLTVDDVSTNDRLDTLLARTYEGLLKLIPSTKLREYRELELDLPWGAGTSGIFSIVKGVVPEIENPSIHRFAQCVRTCDAFLSNDPAYDMFAGASLTPQIARLAHRIDVLSEIPGARKRIRSLWNGASNEVDSTMFELLVAAGCSVMGRSIEFLDPKGGKTPDLRCHDPYPLVIECKRKRVLTGYEINEEVIMRELFVKLDAGARSVGMWGTFSLHLEVEAQAALIDEIVECLLRREHLSGSRLSGSQSWGTWEYSELSRFAPIGARTRMYSPIMLEEIFDWNSDLPEWDGLVCRVKNHDESTTDTAEKPVGLRWVNTSEQAVKKRSWGPMSILGEAIEQIPPGEFGIVFIAHQEGARSTIADMRTFNFSAWLKEGALHSENVRVPFGRLFRMYPRALGHGRPDFIESSISFVADYGDDVLPEMFPGNVVAR
ncbi:hypothetical protein [Burkholderia vietnamiensis]|uniref:hypothetical protein n=1 Tax=Burkholderia vietnamiensis TaxID=60552 RepID=UPI001B9174C6|nr:hypothetical protein [Burkholderia vietnamiensis]MBR8031884.1 hypothetical protein [Burkholderia vietnamiensis]